MANVWLASAVWIGLALLASIISIRIAVSVALIEIVVGAIAGNVIGLEFTQWVNFLAGFGAIMLTFLASTEIDPDVVKRKFWPSMSIGVMGFMAPYLGVLLYAHFVEGWIWPQTQIAGISLSTTSVACRVCGDGGNRLQQDGAWQGHSCCVLYQ
jgi:Kef-type K+ transport system membrane component KefB